MYNNRFRRKKKTAVAKPEAEGQTKKYGNKKVVYDGIKFDSDKEKDRYVVLLWAQHAGRISQLTVHPKWELIPKVGHIEKVQLKTKTKNKLVIDQLAITYTADFSYYKDGVFVVEDVKPSPKLPLPKDFQIKAKMLFWRYKHKIRIVYDASDAV
jgi:hypothetical protein